ncbi:hypothetical protein IWQ61_005034 [Dispira simplex]|nr:hypothetical protein IWQ61_005034 [Dispira simplex]
MVLPRFWPGIYWWGLGLLILTSVWPDSHWIVSAAEPAQVQSGDKAPLSQRLADSFQCSAVYGTGKTLNSYRPAQVNVSFSGTSTAGVSLAIFNWLDEGSIGIPLPDKPKTRQYICTQDAITASLCQADEYGKILVNQPNHTTQPVLTRYINLSEEDPDHLTNLVSYQVNESGIYCVNVFATAQFTGEVQWHNPYGNLPAVDYPKIMFYGLLSLAYLLVSVLWLVGVVRYWREILPMQHYLSALLICLLAAFGIHYGFYRYYNAHGTKSVVLTVLLVIFNSLRNSLSFFMLLLVALGYSVVKPSLGSTMRKCQILAVLHFIFSCIYALATVARLGNNDTEMIGLLAILPLAVTMGTFYMWTLVALSRTVRFLHQRRQNFKLAMYRNLWRLLLACAILILVLVAVNIANFAFRTDPRWVVYRWQVRWLLFDGWLTVIYTFAFFVILFLWRPTPHNYRYGLEELAGDEVDANAREEDFSPTSSPTFAAADFHVSTLSAGRTSRGPTTGEDNLAASTDPAIALRQMASPSHFNEFLGEDDDIDDDHHRESDTSPPTTIGRSHYHKGSRSAYTTLPDRPSLDSSRISLDTTSSHVGKDATSPKVTQDRKPFKYQSPATSSSSGHTASHHTSEALETSTLFDVGDQHDIDSTGENNDAQDTSPLSPRPPAQAVTSHTTSGRTSLTRTTTSDDLHRGQGGDQEDNDDGFSAFQYSHPDPR